MVLEIYPLKAGHELILAKVPLSPRQTGKDAAFSKHDPILEDYLDYLVNNYKYHTIRGFAPRVGGRDVSLPLAKVFMPLHAVEGRPALTEYAEQDLRRQLAGEFWESAGELDWQRRREEMEKAKLSARQAVQQNLSLAELHWI